ncbi:hypothetical protein [Pararhizobium sp.]|uniref:hypothetical protein n=1 Tax=Pararhizobium sp. TaxID=1977563 RepID=UPI002725FC4E|nr:hypothetical protein [Pararhizobium sp.]MDO9418880.1 hypothetical protein [Pararhizobium sp.]
MRRSIATLVGALALVPSLAFADPTGTYDVLGINAGDGSQYTGTVVVKRDGSTYDVKWTIGGSDMFGTGIGSHAEGGQLVAGPGGSNDISLSVGYASGKSYGIANYYKQPNGAWKGVWTFAGSGKVAAETWTPR